MTKPKTSILAPRHYGPVQKIALQSPQAHRITNAGSKAIYDGRELRPFDGRPSAMDAYRLPSRGH